MKPTAQANFARCKGPAGLACLCILLCCVLPVLARADELRLPAVVEAGQGFSISVGGSEKAGSGQAIFYLVGPDHVMKRTLSLGSDVQIQSSDVRIAGRYQVILCESTPASPCTFATFDVRAAQPEHLSFFMHPSRVPVSTPDSIDATAFVFDQYFNLVLTPAVVDFRITPATGAAFSRTGSTKRGVTWMRLGSTPHEGPVRVTAVLGKLEEARVIQQVAAEACSLRMKTVISGSTVTVETDPVRDCSGNALPDGTVVSFTKVDHAGKSTVDTPIKKGIARVQFIVHGRAQISIACGVVLGDDVAVTSNGKL